MYWPKILITILITSWLALTPALLVAAPPMPGDKQRTDQQIVTDTITQPLTDFNMRRKQLPPELIAIQADPYSLNGIKNCRDVIAEVQKIDAVLGQDLDQIEVDPVARKRREGAAQAAGGLISSLIPFRFLIREISGAGQADRDYRAAIYAGVVRRGFLKGYGQHRGCAAPGRPLRPLESAQAAAAEIMDQPTGQLDGK